MTTHHDDTPPRRRGRAAAAASVLAGAALLVFAPFLRGSAAADSSAFTGFNFASVADGLAMTGGDPANQGFPQAQARLAHSESHLNTGPTAYSLSSIWWPGELAGNAGSLTQAFGAPPSMAAFNYPIRAEAYSSGPNETRNDPGMRAYAKGELAEADTHYGRYAAPFQGLSYESISTHTHATIEGDVGISRAESVIEGISLAGGQITIDSVTTVAEVRTDGEAGRHAGETLVTGLHVNEFPAVIDEHGIRFGLQKADDPLDPVAQQLGEQALSQMGMRLTYVGPEVRDDGATQEYRSGALLIHWDVFDQNKGIGTVALGGAFASVQAYPAFVFTAPTLPPTTIPPVTTPPTYPLPEPTVASGDTGPLFTASPPTPRPVSGGAPAVARPSGPATITADPIGTFEGITPAVVLAVAAGTVLMGRGLRRFHGLLAAGTDTSCDLQGGPE